jgi:hypothetical protein
MNRFIDPWTPKTPGLFPVGDRVRIPFGRGSVKATIVEDHGNLGAGGQRVYGVRLRVDEVTDEMYTERDADQITPVSRDAAPKAENTNGARE